MIYNPSIPECMHYGNTCSKCPSRGSREIVGDFVPVEVTSPIQTQQIRFIDNEHLEMTNVVQERRIEWQPVGYPIRCRTCNARYNAYKRAAEAIERMEIIRASQHCDDGSKWKYLKFMTLTFPIEPTDNPEPDIPRATEKYLKVRNHLIENIGVLGGTGVMECVSTFGIEEYQRKDGTTGFKGVDGKWTHNVHFHDCWIAPYTDMTELRRLVTEAGGGRFEYTVLKEEPYTNYRGEERIFDAHKVAIRYLSKYLTKCQGAKRKVFGELRKWKNYLSENLCRVCIKTTNDIRKEYPCQCTTDE